MMSDNFHTLIDSSFIGIEEQALRDQMLLNKFDDMRRQFWLIS